MSLIHVIEQLGTNAALQQLSQAQLMAMFSDAATDKNQLEALLKGNVDGLSELLEVPVYRCVTEVASQDDDSAEEEKVEHTIQQSINLQ
ncbi:hypothetical protein A5320_13840 [Rheinheimera sp. SA_1]|uniref:hypothetical protein n=1 Tax=Rheinheimera sp. SA_1 TaxID=1827365 RepID=UPI0007FE7937|nr:hypothetical protein [Rheinheimera sp. SA_1]OBP14796.1 hypothetical protein A5320_13840 [Rheinheimera sp. SA_1]